MKQISVLAFSLFIGLSMSMATISDAEAKRLGGGKSFGSKTFQNKSAKRSSSKPTKAQQQNEKQKQALSKKGGMMGLLGGLMIGGALGALFFGGAFENINFMDILIFGAIAFLLFKLLSRRSTAQPRTANGAPYEEENPSQDNYLREATPNAANTNNEYTGTGTEADENVLETSKIPKQFDQKSFLNGAENVYELLQAAWDKGDLGDLRQFCTDHVFAELQDQYRAKDKASKTEIVRLQSELVFVKSEGNRTDATVIFNAEINEHDGADDSAITHSQEAWYFVRPDNRQEHQWLLDGIQQIED